MIAFLIISIVCYLLLLGLVTSILVMYFKQTKEHLKEKTEYKQKLNYYINELRKRANIEK